MYLDAFVAKASQALFEYPEPLKYLHGRALDDADIKKYSVGYLRIARIPKENNDDYKALFEATYQFRGLQNRIIFPLRNALGKVNGLVVRDIQKKRYIQYFLAEAKKIGGFFGLHEALPYILRTRKVFVHEGAFDTISFAKVIPNTVSSLTSFLNEQQFEMLRFFADKIILVYDADKAGMIGIDKMTNTYGDRYIESIFLGDSDANACLRTMGLQRFTNFVLSKVPKLLRNEY